MFSTLSKTKIIILAMFDLSSANPFKLDQAGILSFGIEFKGGPSGVGMKILQKY